MGRESAPCIRLFAFAASCHRDLPLSVRYVRRVEPSSPSGRLQAPASVHPALRPTNGRSAARRRYRLTRRETTRRRDGRIDQEHVRRGAEQGEKRKLAQFAPRSDRRSSGRVSFGCRLQHGYQSCQLCLVSSFDGTDELQAIAIEVMRELPEGTRTQVLKWNTSVLHCLKGKNRA
jgi:hypothetical protein